VGGDQGRIMLNQTASDDPADPGINRTLAAAARHSLPVNMLIWGRLDQTKGLAARNPDTVLVIDHLGLQQPFHPPPPAEPWAEFSKISGACTLSHRPFPYDDIWDPVMRIIDAFGLDRCMWGTDWTRATELLTYEQGVRPFRESTRLSDGDKAKLMGGTLERVYRRPPQR
jgi:predicted TIM-barrel fold metal-dependent hydrolase